MKTSGKGKTRRSQQSQGSGHRAAPRGRRGRQGHGREADLSRDFLPVFLSLSLSPLLRLTSHFLSDFLREVRLLEAELHAARTSPLALWAWLGAAGLGLEGSLFREDTARPHGFEAPSPASNTRLACGIQRKRDGLPTLQKTAWPVSKLKVLWSRAKPNCPSCAGTQLMLFRGPK